MVVTDVPSDRPSTRREHLRYLGSIGMSVSLAGCSLLEEDEDRRTTTPPRTRTTEARPESEELTPTREERLEERFEAVVDVAEAGGDDTGEEPVNELIRGYLDDDTVFVFPEGTYRISDLLVVQGYSNVGFVGPDATLRPTDGQKGYWLIFDDVSDVLFEGFTVSNEAEETGVRVRLLVSGGKNVVKDVEVKGFHDVSTQTHAFTLQVSGSESYLIMDGVEMADGANNGTAIYTHPAEDPGELRLRDCVIENWYEQGLYGSPHGGPMYIIGGRYANNGTAQVRVGGGNADTHSVVRDVDVRITEPRPARLKRNTRGIWLHEGDETVVENCDITVTELSRFGSSGALVVGPEHGRATIRNVSIQVDASTFAIAATKPKKEDFSIPGLDHPPENWNITGAEVEITGDASNQVAVLVHSRPGSEFRNVDIRQSGEDRDGLGVLWSPGTTLRGCSCLTTAYPLITNGNNEDGACNVQLEDNDQFKSRNLDSSPDDEVIRTEDGRFCLSGSNLDVDSIRKGIGVVRTDTSALHARALSYQQIKPFE